MPTYRFSVIFLFFIENFFNYRTTGGSGGPVTTVTTLDDLTSAVAGDDPKIVIISGMYFYDFSLM